MCIWSFLQDICIVTFNFIERNTTRKNYSWCAYKLLLEKLGYYTKVFTRIRKYPLWLHCKSTVGNKKYSQPLFIFQLKLGHLRVSVFLGITSCKLHFPCLLRSDVHTISKLSLFLFEHIIIQYELFDYCYISSV